MRALLEEEATHALEDEVALECGNTLVLAREVVRISSAEWRARCRVGWVELKDARDGTVRCFGQEVFFEELEKLAVGAVGRLLKRVQENP